LLFFGVSIECAWRSVLRMRLKCIDKGLGILQRVINEDDVHMKKLKEDLGAEVMQTVAAAFFEMEEYNASGRYPVQVAWDFQKNQRVLLKDLLLYLEELLDAGWKPGKAKKKRLRAV
jgi:hypothetical protein